MKEPADKTIFALRWKYVALPLAVLLLAVILAAAFYSRLPYPVAYHFQTDGAPDRWAIPGLFIFWMLVPQFLLTLGAIAITFIISRVGMRFLDPKSIVIDPRRIMLLTGNMVALAQVILLYALLDICIYNTAQRHIGISLLIFALAVMALGGIILGAFFLQMMQKVLASNKIPAKK